MAARGVRLRLRGEGRPVVDPIFGLPVITGPGGQRYVVDPRLLRESLTIPREPLLVEGFPVESPAQFAIRFSLIDRITPQLRALSLAMAEFGGTLERPWRPYRLPAQYRLLARRRPQRPAYPKRRPHRRH